MLTLGVDLNLGQTMGLIWVLDYERNLFALVLNLGQTRLGARLGARL